MRLFSKSFVLAALIGSCFCTTALAADPEDPELVDIGSLDFEEMLSTSLLVVHHIHRKGEWMVSYEFSHMAMTDVLDGQESVSLDQVHEDFMTSPVSMTMQMHMAHLMYAPSDRVTLMVMTHVMSNAMTNQPFGMKEFEVKSAGFGDLELMAHWSAIEGKVHHLLVLPGVSLPTGSIKRRDATAMGPNQKLPYPMQLGAGTLGLQPGVGYLGQTDQWSWSLDLLPRLYIGNNSADYRLGNRYKVAARVSASPFPWIAGGLGLRGQRVDKIAGQDEELMPPMTPSAVADNLSGERLEGVVTLAVQLPGKLDGVVVNVEGALPVYERLDGPQLATAFTLKGGCSLTWAF